MKLTLPALFCACHFAESESKVKQRQMFTAARPHLLFLGLLTLLFCWFYGQFVHRLYFAMDDYIESNLNLARPLSAVISDCIMGNINWSGYRPGTCALRAVVSHQFGAESAVSYYVINLAFHFFNTLLVFWIAQRFFKALAWSFLASAIFLLLPSHNEAVFWYSGNSNLIALFFALTTLLAVLIAPQQQRWYWWVVAWLAYLLAVLIYEVILPLPLLLWLMEWVINKKPIQRYQIFLYGGFFILSCGLIGLRMWAMGGQLTISSDFYAVTLVPSHILRNYRILLGQLFFLHTSPWEGMALYTNNRAWLSPWSTAALASFVITATSGLIWLVYTWRQPPTHTRTPLQWWLLWALLWLFLISLPFTLLVGRNPENRYVYLPSFGFSIALSAAFALLYQAVAHIASLRAGVLALAVTLLSIYSYVDTSDAHEWVQAGRHAKSFLTQTQTLVAKFPQGSKIFQIGLPSNIGTAYVFMIDDALRDGLRWFYQDQSLQVATGEAKLRDYLHSEQAALAETYLLYYDKDIYTTRLIDWVKDCPAAKGCTYYPLATFAPAQQADRQIDFQGGIQFVGQRLSHLYPLGGQLPMAALATCWTVTAAPMHTAGSAVDLTLFVHFTNETGEITIGQADHKLQQAYPFTPLFLPTSQWPLRQPICDVTGVDDKWFEASNQTPISLRGGLWLPEVGKHFAPQVTSDNQIDQYGRIIFSELQKAP